jgi:hypothetical protein
MTESRRPQIKLQQLPPGCKCPVLLPVAALCLSKNCTATDSSCSPRASPSLLLLHRHKTRTTVRTWIVRTALSQPAAKTTGEGCFFVVTLVPHNRHTCSLPCLYLPAAVSPPQPPFPHHPLHARRRQSSAWVRSRAPSTPLTGGVWPAVTGHWVIHCLRETSWALGSTWR